LLPHHRSLLALAALAPACAASPQVLTVAEGITSSREPEVARMEDWLDEWGEATSPAVASPTPELAAARADAFDRMLAELVLEHHEAAVTLAEDEIADLESVLRRTP
jgi:uncharacterized protein (DUF305 family)